MLQALCSLSVCPVYMRHKNVNMDVNSAFLKLTSAMACVKIILNVKQKKFIAWISQLSTINKYLKYKSKNLQKKFFKNSLLFFLLVLEQKQNLFLQDFL